jgi:serine/threonine protein kinase
LNPNQITAIARLARAELFSESIRGTRSLGQALGCKQFEEDVTFMATASGELEIIVDPLVGRVLNERYRLLDVVGTGGMATVYRAVQEQLERTVAVKVLNHHYAANSDPNFLKRFLREASLSSKLRHPNTVTVLDYGHTQDGVYYIAMELLEGQTLSKKLSQGGALPWAQALDFTQQIARSLREAHRMGIVHRDLKPANVMLLPEGEETFHVKVLDFGLVKPLAGLGSDDDNQELTAHGMFLGSPTYMAPEQSRNYSDLRSDVYSLGVVLYQMLTGRPPFVSKDYLELIRLHQRHRPELPSLQNRSLVIPPPVDELVMRCLKKNPESRFQNMDELLEGLKIAQAPVPAPIPVTVSLRRQTESTVTEQVRTPRVSRGGAASRARPRDRIRPSSYRMMETDPGASALTVRTRPFRSFRHYALLGGLTLASVVGSWLFLDWYTGSSKLLSLTEKAIEQPARVPAAPVEEDILPSQALVRFRLATDPSGAEVFHRGERVGSTPMSLHVPADEDGMANVEVTFKLKDHQPETVIAGGQGQVLLTQKLRKYTQLSNRKVAVPAEKPSPDKAAEDDEQAPTEWAEDSAAEDSNSEPSAP